MSRSPEPDHTFCEQLLPTSAEEVTGELRARVSKACSALPAVRAAYAWQTHRETPDGQVTHDIRIAIEPMRPLTRAGRSPLPDEVMNQLLNELACSPAQGVAVLSEHGIDAWRRLGVCVYEEQTERE
jgi:hypothetical protein